MKCLDSSFLIDILLQKKEAIETLRSLKDQKTFTTSLSEYEVLIGVYLKGYSQKKIQDAVSLLNAIPVLNFDSNSALTASQISAELTQSGKTIGDVDCMIAGIMLSNDCNEIITKDIKHFDRIKGIIVSSY